MEICLVCGKEYDVMVEPMHEDDCQDAFVKTVGMKIKTNPELRSILENLLNEK